MKLTLTVCTLLLSSLSAYAKKDPVDYANYLRANKANAIVADSILGRVTPLFTGYSTINDAVPVPILVNCHYGGTYLGPADQSRDAQTYRKNIEYIAADGYQPVTVMQQANTYNQSWGLGLVWEGGCMIQEQKPYCNFTLNALSRASGLAQMTRVPSGGSVKFDSCSIVMDGAKVSSKTCFQDDSTTVVGLGTDFAEDSIVKIYFTTTFTDTSETGPKGEYTLQFPCQYAFNSGLAFNPFSNAVGLDPRITAVVPTFDNGLYGSEGNLGNQGRRMLKA